MSFPPVAEQLAAYQRGSEGLYNEADLKQKLEASATSGRPLRIKLGMDPTAPDIHLGHTVVLQKMRQFQDMGHRAVLIIGDFTSRIGDPSGKSKTRPVLGEETIKANAETYFQQAGKVLDTDPEKLEIRYNSEWLAEMGLADILRLTSHMTVAQMLQRENFKERMKNEVDIVLTELMYPLMQGYDSVVIDADVELGGTDQTFNNLVGRDLMGRYGKSKQVVIVMPILRGLDGVDKMSKSLGNYIAVTDSPKDMFGKTMKIDDGMMREWYTLLTELAADEIDTVVDSARTHPRDAKVRLAKMIVTRYYDAAAADREEDLWQKVMRGGELRDDIPTKAIDRSDLEDDGSVLLPKLMSMCGLCNSNSEGRRLIAGGGVKVDREKVTDGGAVLTPADGTIIQVGKKKAVKIELQ